MAYESATKSEKTADELKSDHDLLTMLDRFWFEAVSHPIAKNFITEAGTDFGYYEGWGQWTDTEKAVLKARGQAPIVENEVKPIIDRIFGQYKQQKLNVKMVGRNAPDDPLGWKITALLRWIDQQNLHEFEEASQVLDGLIGGRGVTEIRAERNAMGSYSIVERAEDTFTIFPDPYSRSYDWNRDARYICRAKWMDLDEAQMLWPDHKAELARCLTSGYTPGFYTANLVDPKILQTRVQFYLNSDRKLLRPVECWYKKQVLQQWVLTPDGPKDVTGLPASTINELSKGQAPNTRAKSVMCVGVFCAGIVLDHGPSPHRHHLFPFVPFFANRKKDGEPYGEVRNLRDPQDEVNHRRSRGIYMLNQHQVRFEEGAIKNQSALADEMAKADGQIVLERGSFKLFAMNESHDIGKENLALMQESKMAMQRISGEDHLQVPGEMRSGKGVQRMQQVYQLGNLRLAENMRQTRRISMKLKFEMMKQYITEEQEFLITEKQKTPQTVQVTGRDLDAIQEWTYDLVVEDTTNLETTRQEQIETIMQVLPALAQHGPAMVTLGMSLVDIPERDEILKVYQSQLAPPPPEPKYNVSITWGELTPMERAAFSMRFGMQELAQVEMQGQTQPQHITKAKTDLEKTIIKTKSAAHAADVQAVGQVTAHRADMEAQARDQAHEQAMAQMEQAHETNLAAQEPPPAGGA